MIDLIRRLVETYGPSGAEEQIRAAILKEIEGLADEASVDAMGSVIAWRRSGQPGAPVVMLAAHMDEIGMMITHITAEGFLRFTPIGGLFRNTLHGNRVIFADGTIGVIGVDSPVGAHAIAEQDQFFIDAGDGTNGRQGGHHSIRVGDTAGLLREMVVNGSRLIAKSMDDRIGCAVQIEVMRALAGQPLPNDVAFVFSVQEEVGVRGAQTAAYAVDPAIGIAIDVTRTGDTPKGLKMDVNLGKGPAIKVKDSGMLASPEVVALMENAARKAGVPYQLEVLEQGTTDARAMQLVRAGVRSGCLSIPCRYIHTTSETVDINDVLNGVKLLAALLRDPVEV